jgi:hypothetical protein
MKLTLQLNLNPFKKELRLCLRTTGTTGYAKSNQKPFLSIGIQNVPTILLNVGIVILTEGSWWPTLTFSTL